MMRECRSCGSRSIETRFPERNIKGLPVLCLDCALEFASHARAEAALQELKAGTGPQRSITTRASYRARLRVRQASPQMDLVDAVVRSP